MAVTAGVALGMSLLGHAQVTKEAAEKLKQKAQMKKAAPILRPAVGGGAVLPAQPVDLAAQTAERTRPYLNVEYHFLRMVCGLSEDERKVMARAAVQAFNEAIAQYEEMRRTPQLRLARAQPRVLPEPRTLLQEGLVRAAEKRLSPERAARYREELAQRSLERKRVTVERLVEWLDHELMLSIDQNLAVTVALTGNWDESWFPTELMKAIPERFVSRIPRQHIVSVLDPDQTRLWDQLLRNPINSGGIVMNPTGPIDFPEDEELATARAAEAREAEVAR
jgi:hypothetical protein